MDRGRSTLLAGLLLLGLGLWVVHPALGDPAGVIIGDPRTDAVRGMWGTDLVRRSLLPPDAVVWTREVNVPDGATALILPLVTSMLLAPLGALFGPLAAWNLGIALVLALGGATTAGLVRQLTGSSSAGLAAGGAMLAQPMLLHSLTDGTLEHAAIWTAPLFLLLLLRAAHLRTAAAAALAGVAATLVALDSPYLAIYAASFALALLPSLWAAAREAPRPQAGRALAIVGLSAGLGAVLLALLYHQFPSRPDLSWGLLDERRGNAANLALWWQFEAQPERLRESTVPPTLIPLWTLLPSLVLGLAGGRRAWPWLVAGGLWLSLSFGNAQEGLQALTHWWGATGRLVADSALGLNDLLYRLPGVGSIRFPRRLLIPAALALSVAGGVGLARLEGLLGRWRDLRWPIAALLAVGGASSGVQAARFHQPFPLMQAPQLQVVDWLATQGPGAIHLIPHRRAALQATERHALPVFAGLDGALASADGLYIQARSGRAIVGWPDLLTLAARPHASDVEGLLRDLDDLSLPQTIGAPLPPGVTDPTQDGRRRSGADALVAGGLRYLLIDDALYGEQERLLIRSWFGRHAEAEQVFADGTGVRVLMLE